MDSECVIALFTHPCRRSESSDPYNDEVEKSPLQAEGSLPQAETSLPQAETSLPQAEASRRCPFDLQN